MVAIRPSPSTLRRGCDSSVQLALRVAFFAVPLRIARAWPSLTLMVPPDRALKTPDRAAFTTSDLVIAWPVSSFAPVSFATFSPTSSVLFPKLYAVGVTLPVVALVALVAFVTFFDFVSLVAIILNIVTVVEPLQ
jgi:hypothetical protein